MGDFVGIRKEPLKLQIGCRAPRPTQLKTCIAATTAEPSCIDMLRERFASGIAEKPIKHINFLFDIFEDVILTFL
jgi:hypothetical protein